MNRPLRFFVFRFLFLAPFLVLLLRLFDLQILNHGHYLSLAQNQHYQFQKIPATRGEILAADGSRLAKSENTYLVFANPHEIENDEKIADRLTSILWEARMKEQERITLLQKESGLFEAQVETPKPSGTKDQYQEFKDSVKDKLAAKNLYWIAIEHYVSEETMTKIQNQKIKGIYFESEAKRIYPEDLLAAHILGFLGKNDKGEDLGYFGLEGYYNADLAGIGGLARLEKDPLGNPIPVAQSLVSEAVSGRKLTLTLNRELQYILENDLKEGVEKYKAESGSLILLDPKTGAVMALANYPTFSPENWPSYLGQESDVAKISVFFNLAVSQNYEPGSVFKPITVAGALENKVIQPDTIFDDSGPLTVSGNLIRTWDNKYHGKIDIGRILQLSDNTGAAWIGMKLGLDKFFANLTTFGLGKKTAIDLQGEDLGIIKPKKEWGLIDLATAAFGQGLAITPIQLISAYTAFANDGKIMRPYVVSKIEAGDRIIETVPKVSSQPISSGTAATIREMLRGVVDKGEFKWFVKQAGLDRWDLGGKTGTAQIPIQGKYDPSQTEVTFIGMAPVSSPKFILLVKLDKPKTSTYSADTAVPLWLEMAKKLVVYFNIPPRY